MRALFSVRPSASCESRRTCFAWFWSTWPGLDRARSS
jgi:hypothetical protein